MRKLDSKKYFIAIIGFGVLFFLVSSLFLKPKIDHNHSESNNENEPVQNNIINQVSQNLPSRSNSSDVTVATNVAVTADTVKDLSVAQLQDWILSESKELNNSAAQNTNKESELKAIVKNLTHQQVEYLVSAALNVKSTANERILSTYMMTLATGSEGNDVLVQIAKKSLPDFGPLHPHSEAELKHSQELALRYMSVDELALRAKTDDTALQKLKNLAVEAESSEIRNYAQRKLKEIH